jgi:7-cyano-7-deazaguanine synthase
MKKDKALVLFSGGQDSTTCLFWAKKNFREVEAVGFNYGQRHLLELDAATQIAKKANVPYHIFQLHLLNELTENSLTRKDIKVGPSTIDGELPNTFVDGRNMVFLTYAAIYAKSRKIKHIVAGMGQTDYSGYPDCRDIFIKSINVTLNLAMAYEFAIHTPLMFLSKQQTWEMADILGIFDLVKNETVTCYNGIPGNGCGECPACILREQGLQEFYVKSNY